MSNERFGSLNSRLICCEAGHGLPLVLLRDMSYTNAQIASNKLVNWLRRHTQEESMNSIKSLQKRVAELEVELKESKSTSSIPAVTEKQIANINKGGRPAYFSCAEDMQAAIDDYFEDADAKKWPYTVPDLALALGFTSRQSLINYEIKGEFLDTVKRAKLRIEAQRARQLVQGSGIVAGQIFDLKNNFGWRDEKHIEAVNESKTIVQNNVGLIGMPPEPKNLEEWEQWYKKIIDDKKRAGEGNHVVIDVLKI